MIASAATTWSAVGALATLATALVAIVAAFVYTRRQTVLAERAAGNAKVSADASLAAERATLATLEVTREQLEIARINARAAEQQVNLALDSLFASQRPHLIPDRLTWNESSESFFLRAKNQGAGPGHIREIKLSLPSSSEEQTETLHGEATTFIIPVGGEAQFRFRGPAKPPPTAGNYLVAVKIENAVGADPRYIAWAFKATTEHKWSTGVAAGPQLSRPATSES